jgi:phenylpropionate dioxygenase-like ring-hydroxylating dioxygenase large terminal subunit
VLEEWMTDSTETSAFKARTADAPIEQAALSPVLEPLGQARTLPSSAYTSDEVLEWERRHFFEGAWFCVGRSSRLANAGDQIGVRIGSEGILLVRDERGLLRGFFNVCRHRGHELVEYGASSTQRVIRCPYHAWVYGLDGGLRAAPRFRHLSSADPVYEGLIPARVVEWLGWVFVNASGEGVSFTEYVGNLTGLMEDYCPERLVLCATHEYDVRANWKIIVENYHECYHCTNIHPELCRVTPPSSGESYEPDGFWVGGSMDLMPDAETMSLDGESKGAPIPGLSAVQARQVFYFGLFPNLLISPHPDYVMTHRLEPLESDLTRIECQWLFPPVAAEKEGFDPSYAVEFWDLTNRQDWHACESVQRGAQSSGYRQGPLAIEEDNVHQFQTMVAGGYLSGGPARPARPVRVGSSEPTQAPPSCG